MSPILPGHSLIVPKEHFVSFMDLNNDLISELSIFSKTVTTILREAFQTKDFNWTIQDGEAAGQTIIHLHLHIIPRKTNDLPDPGDWYPKLKDDFYNENIDSKFRKKLTNNEMTTIVKHLRQLSQKA